MGLIDNGISVAVGGIIIGAISIPILLSIDTALWNPTAQLIYPFVTTFLILSLLLATIWGAFFSG